MTCYRKKGTVWPGKWILFRRTWIWVSWLWEELCAKLLAPGQIVGYPLKLWGITVQISCMEGRWHRNWFQSRCYFCGRPRKNQNFWQKTRCFIKRFVTFNLYKDILNPWILSPWRFQLSPFRKICTLNFFFQKRDIRNRHGRRFQNIFITVSVVSPQCELGSGCSNIYFDWNACFIGYTCTFWFHSLLMFPKIVIKNIAIMHCKHDV